jgi:hypothetical protein
MDGFFGKTLFFLIDFRICQIRNTGEASKEKATTLPQKEKVASPKLDAGIPSQ